MVTLTCLRTAAAASFLAVSTTALASAQDSASARPRTQRARPPKIEARISVTGEYDNNVFLLSGSQRDDLENPSPAEQQSGRFDAMENVSDATARLGAGVALETRGFTGRDLTLEPELAYEYYVRNSERRNLTAAFTVTQNLPHSARFRLAAAYTPDYFAKNYLADAIDRNADGSISDDERIYAPGRYSDTELKGAYRFRLRRSARNRPLAVYLEPSLGYYNRSYDAPFEERDRQGPRAGVGVDFDAGRTELAVEYLFESLSADVAPTVLIVDESSVGRDLNGNATTTDLNARTVQPIDRSRKEHSVGAALTINPPGPADFLLQHQYRLRDFSSTQELDVAHRGRRDHRNEMRAEIGFGLWGNARWATGARIAKQTTNRASDPAGLDDVDDYSRIRAYSGLRIRF